jgi:hypothetical protein
MHTLLDLRGSIPSFIHVSDGKLHDVHALDLLAPEPGAIYVMDRGYVDFARLHRLHLAGAFFVTRAKSNLKAHRIYSVQTDRSAGILCDQTIMLNGFYSKRDYPAHLRRVRFKDSDPKQAQAFVHAHGESSRIDIAIDPSGAPSSFTASRWGNPAGSAYHHEDFGGLIEEEQTWSGVTIPSKLRLGWFWGTPRFEEKGGEFFRVTIDKAEFR